jgi:GR25 family glycosyltransferase involved in LPS biosynthesis
MLTNISDIKNIFYINLEKRTDRRKLVEKELLELDLIGTRFNAVKSSPHSRNCGAIGCSLSHLKCLYIAKKNNWDHVMIVEDDIQFLNPETFKNQLNSFLYFSENKFDVLLLAGNNMLPFLPVNNNCIQVMNCQTTTGYIVLNHYFDTLIANIKEGISKLIQYSDDIQLYAIDKYWIKLQRKHEWFLLIPLTVVQRKNYSDIQLSITDFSTYMLNYNKTQTIV